MQVVKNYSTSKTVTWTPKTSGTYRINVIAKDSKGNTRKKTISRFVVNPKVKVSVYRMVANDKDMKLTIRVTGGSKKYVQRFAYKKSGSSKIVRLTNYTTKKSLSFRPRKSGKYTIYVYVKDTVARVTTKKTLTNFRLK